MDASNNDGKPDEKLEWEKPLELPDTQITVPSMTADMLPESLRVWLTDIADLMSVPLDYAGVTAMAALGSVIGGQVSILPKNLDESWTVVPNIYGALVGESGSRKTPTIFRVLKPLQDLQDKEYAKFEKAKRAYDQILAVQKKLTPAFKKDRTEEIRRAAKLDPLNPEDQPGISSLYDSLRVGPLPPPRCKRYVVNDTTTPQLQVIQAENPNGLLYFRDELSGWLAFMEQPGRENDRSYFLEGADGNMSYSVDRIGRAHLTIPRNILSIIGGFTPDPFYAFLTSRAFKENSNDGMIQRFGLAVHPNPVLWKGIDRVKNSEAEQRAFTSFAKLADLKKVRSASDQEPLRLHFDQQAQKLFNQWHDQLQRRVGDPNTREHRAFLSHLSKYASLMPSIAGISYITDQVAAGRAITFIDQKSTLRAIQWCEYLEAHARRIYAGVNSREDDATRQLAGRITARFLKDGFTLRNVRRAHWAGLTDRAVVEEALDLLEELYWLRGVITGPAKGGRGGRPTKKYLINPNLAFEEIKPRKRRRGDAAQDRRQAKRRRAAC